MASLRTEITEIVTGLGMLGLASVDEALATRPAQMVGVGDRHYDKLIAARAAGEHGLQFDEAWANGVAFAAADEGLRDRVPRRVEWKGPHQAPAYEQVPADLRVDHVYLVSCKYGSRLLHNVSPAHLFERLLAVRQVDKPGNWYARVAPNEYQALYRAAREHLVGQGAGEGRGGGHGLGAGEGRGGGDRGHGQGAGFEDLPPTVTDLDTDLYKRLKEPFSRRWPDSLVEPARWFSVAVSQASAERWLAALGSRATRREEALWRLLRLQPAPYFVLGTDHRRRPVRYRVGTPWDFRRQYEFKSFDVWPEARVQPVVCWRADLIVRATGTPVHVDGHVEVRWSHGRFQGSPEAKVYLKTAHLETPGYTELS
ncbi:hypothetical protein [Candidatus Poriferisocius sp.]|uniref:hypothetical protein n=1 Tax=Candidatus Poriferisocius sp. TaxID=3101276 RepID=UPI003B022056